MGVKLRGGKKDAEEEGREGGVQERMKTGCSGAG